MILVVLVAVACVVTVATVIVEYSKNSTVEVVIPRKSVQNWAAARLLRAEYTIFPLQTGDSEGGAAAS
jgi:hypothetical protein